MLESSDSPMHPDFPLSTPRPKPKEPSSPAAARPRRAVAREDATSPPLPVPFDELADSLGYAIRRAQVRSYALLFRSFAANSLTPGRMTALWIVASEPGVSQSELADRLSITRASVVKVVDSLEALGLVQRQPVPQDRRSYALTLTTQGLRELERHRDMHALYEVELAAGLSRAERRQLLALLEKVAAG
jgi:DNA-binding MarR family transcriptional regulator